MKANLHDGNELLYRFSETRRRNIVSFSIVTFVSRQRVQTIAYEATWSIGPLDLIDKNLGQGRTMC